MDEEYRASTYGDTVADVYDALYGQTRNTDDEVRLLAELAGDGPVLELAVGTGRVAIPLAATGLDVHGIDASEAMVAQLRAKPGSERIRVAIDDFADVGLDGEYTLVFVVFNTFFALLDVDDQLRCFENVASHLAPGGRFVIDAFVPDPTRFERGQHVEVTHVGIDQARLNVSRHDAASQRVDSLIVLIGADGTRTWPVRVRYAYPTELDLMAKLAGLRLEHRWGGWCREPFTSESVIHVSVYARS
jgi:SAM-dependent methyltransferase